MQIKAGLLVLGGMLIAVSSIAGQGSKGAVAPGKNLPGTFHPYNVNVAISPTAEPDDGKSKSLKYTTRGKFHCLISEYDLDPVVMIVCRGLHDNVALKSLLEKLDSTMDRNRQLRLRVFVVFLYDDIKDVLADDEAREKWAKELERLATEKNLKQVVLTLASPADLAKYDLDDAAALTAILYNRLNISAVHNVTRDKLDSADAPAIKAILDDVKSKLGAKN